MNREEDHQLQICRAEDPLFTINIKLPDGSISPISILSLDTPIQLAYRFSQLNQIPIKYVKPISQSLIDIISSATRDPRIDAQIRNYYLSVFSKFLNPESRKILKQTYFLHELADIDLPTRKKLTIHDQKHYQTETVEENHSKLIRLEPCSGGLAANFERIKIQAQNLKPKMDIYERSMIKMNQINEKNKTLKEQMEKSEISTCTFTPVFSTNHQRNDSDHNRVEKLFMYGTRKVREKRSNSYQQVEDLSLCTFTPQINEQSKKIITLKRESEGQNENQTKLQKLLSQFVKPNGTQRKMNRAKSFISTEKTKASKSVDSKSVKVKQFNSNVTPKLDGSFEKKHRRQQSEVTAFNNITNIHQSVVGQKKMGQKAFLQKMHPLGRQTIFS